MVEKIRYVESVASFQKAAGDFAKERNSDGVFGVSFVFDMNLPDEVLKEMMRKSGMIEASLNAKGLRFDVSYSFSQPKGNSARFINFTRRERPEPKDVKLLAENDTKASKNDSLHMILNDYNVGRVSDSLYDLGCVDRLEDRPRLIVLMHGELEYPEMVERQIKAIEEKGSLVLRVEV